MHSLTGQLSVRCRAQRVVTGLLAVLPLSLALVCRPSTLHAQGLAGAAVRGTVRDASGRPVAEARVAATHLQSGVARLALTNRDGVYRLDNLAVGMYRIVARHVGAQSAPADSVVLHLGDERVVDLLLGAEEATALRALTIRASAKRETATPATLSRPFIQTLPVLNRDFVGLFATSPQAVGPNALWISGQHARLNAIQVDGANASDLFGVNVSAGSGAGGKPISLEALEEVRILVAPFDVRQGGFSGGLINAVTRSGTNTPHGSAFSAVARSELVGADTAGMSVPAFDQVQFGGSVSGPIVPNKLHYFFAGEWQSRSAQQLQIPTSDVRSVVSEATASRIASAIREQYGFDPGDASAPQQRQPNGTGFMKLSWNPSERHAFEITATVTSAEVEALNRSSTTSAVNDGWQLSNSGSTSRSATRGVRARALSNVGRFSNEAILGFRITRDDISSRSTAPLFLIGGDRPQNYVAAGSVKNAQQTTTAQRVFEFTDNFTWRTDNHQFTVGTQNVIARVSDTFFLGGWGLWTFGSVDSLERALPNYYEVAQPQAGRSNHRVSAQQSAFLSVYAQDEWLPHRRLALSLGVRADAAVFERPQYNAGFAANTRLGNISTAQMPGATPVISPRISVSWQLREDHATRVRAGIGRFTSRTPLAWIGNAYRFTGLEQRTLVCDSDRGVPSPTGDINHLPAQCRNGDGVARPSIASFDRDFRAQQATKYTLGLEHSTGALVVSADLVHTLTNHALFVSDINLVSPGTNAEGRVMYGAPTQRATGVHRLDSSTVDGVYRYSNVDGERATGVTLSLQRSWANRSSLRVGYHWSRTQDIMSLAGFNGPIFLRNNPIDGSLARRNLRRSARDIPHTLVATAIGQLGGNVTASLFVRARSGTPYAMTTTGDANGDGVQRNDLLYIPRDSADLPLLTPRHYAALDAWIERQPCVQAQRGRIMERNSCRNPFVTAVDMRLSKRVIAGTDRHFEVSIDLFNAANLLNRTWGLVRESTGTEFLPTLNVVRLDAAGRRVVYAVPVGMDGQPALPAINRVTPDPSRWRAQIGVRFEY